MQGTPDGLLVFGCSMNRMKKRCFCAYFGISTAIDALFVRVDRFFAARRTVFCWFYQKGKAKQ